MAFGLQKLAVLESKLDIYEDLSKEMLDKLERAVATISENSNRVAIILERHESRLNESDKADQAIMSLVERVEDKVKELEKKVDETQKYMVMGTAILATVITLLQILPNIGLSLTPTPKTSMMDAAVIHRIV